MTYPANDPYLLQQAGWDRIVTAGAKILLKKRFGPHLESVIIQRDVDAYEASQSWHAQLSKHLYTVLITCGVFSAVLGAILGWLLCKFL